MAENPLRILFVEDSASDLRLLQNELRKAGFTLDYTHAQTEAEYSALLETQPDIILCDYSMPQFDAPRALELLRQRSSEIPFVIVSGSIGEETAVQAIKQGANDYLLKDRLGRLGPVVRNALAYRKFREAERHAQETLARDALLLANVRDSVIVTDTNGIVTYWNEGATRLFGWTAEEMLGQLYVDRFAEPLRTVIAQAIQTRLSGIEWNGEFEDRRKDGSRVWVYARVVDILDSGGQRIGVLGISIDISERKAVEAERAAAQEQREQMLRDRELILLENARLLRAVAETAVQQRQFLKDVLSSVTEGRLTLCDSQNDLPVALSPTRPAAGNPAVSMTPESVPLSSLTLRDLRRQVEMVAAACGLPTERQWDFQMAVGEAAMNAVVHAGGGVGQVIGNAEQGKIQVWIADHGTGIELSHLPRATLERGYSTAGTMGHGFWMILQTCDRVYLLTGALGTTVVLEQSITPPSPFWLQTK